MLLEGTHFDLARVSPAQLGWKSVGVSLSDIAAMGMEPLACVAAVGLPESTPRAFCERLYGGMRELADRFDVAISGGDVTSWGASRVVVCVTALGRTVATDPVLRSGARAGDAIVVTGELGGSLLGRHVRFVPRVTEALALCREYHPHAMIDLSDGLSNDLAHVAVESGLGAVVEASSVPVSADAVRAAEADGRTALEHALNDGEDYELLVTLDPDEARGLAAEGVCGTPVTVVGRMVEGDAMVLREADGSERPLEPGGYEHLRGG
jgi:thiamine-monophosphate kinase